MVKEVANDIQDVANCLHRKLIHYPSLIAIATNDLCKDESEEFRNTSSPPIDHVDYVDALLRLARCSEGLYVLSLTATGFVNAVVLDGISTELAAISKMLLGTVESAHREKRLDYKGMREGLLILKQRVTNVTSVAAAISNKAKLDSDALYWINQWNAHSVSPVFPYDAQLRKGDSEPNLVVLAIINSDLEMLDNKTCTMSEFSQALGYGKDYLKSLKHKKKAESDGDNSPTFPACVGKRGRSELYPTQKSELYPTQKLVAWLQEGGEFDRIRQKLRS